ncbi:MAG TPA: hypothetical protein VKE51_24040 [Vicinamibacterales bacterium]|nr:hypothetical protein [Vicinamibacterales bacterium]
MVLIVASPAFSQVNPIPAPPTTGGLFGPTRSEAAAHDKLNLFFDVSETFDSALSPEARYRVGRADLQSGGFSTLVVASGDYARLRPRVDVIADAMTAVRYYEGVDQVTPVTHSAGLAVTARLPKRGSLEGSQAFAYSPSYWYQLFPTGPSPAPEPIPPNPDYRIDEVGSYSYDTKMALAFGSPRQFRIAATSEYQHTDFQQATITRPTLTLFQSGAKVSRLVTRNVGLSVGYQYRAGEIGSGSPTKEHRLTIGAEYSRALSTQRRARFRVNLTPTTIEGPASFLMVGIDAVASASDKRFFKLQGDGSVDYEFRPKWRAKGNYSRGLEYLAILRQPVFADGVRAELTGLITRQIDLLASAGYATGSSALYSTATDLKTRTSVIRIRYALRHSYAIYSEYLYYYYDLSGQALLAPGLPKTYEQHAIRAGVMLFVRGMTS